jgi:hypothetical protein
MHSQFGRDTQRRCGAAWNPSRRSSTDEPRRDYRLRELGYDVSSEKALNKQAIDFKIISSLEASVLANVLE